MIAAGLAVSVLTGAFLLLSTPEQTLQYPVERLVKYRFSVTNPTNRLLEKTELWVYAPVRQTPTQRVRIIESSEEFEMKVDALGNQQLHFTIRDLPPFGSQTIAIKAELDLSDQPNPMDTGAAGQFMKEEKYIEVHHPRIRAVAERLHAKDPRETAKAIFDWVSQSINNEAYLRNDHGALYALDQKRGDCTEYMYLYAALSRANGIPARGIAGFVVTDNALLKVDEYHNWVEIYIDGLWRVVDPQRKVFMEKPSNYIAMRILSRKAGEDAVGSQRLFSANDGVQVVMN